MPFGRAPAPDPSLDPFRSGVGVLKREGTIAGYAATEVTWFWSPFSPRRRQWWVWMIVVWADGAREPSIEDYPPWSFFVAGMKAGVLVWRDVANRGRAGRYDFAFLPAEVALATRERLGISREDF